MQLVKQMWVVIIMSIQSLKEIREIMVQIIENVIEKLHCYCRFLQV